MSLVNDLNSLTAFHHDNCNLYQWYLDTLFPNFHQAEDLEALPWLPVRAFKHHVLKSIPDEKVFKVMLSSGTSGLQSKIYLDQRNAKNQQSKLVQVFSQTFGMSRYPMLVIDAESTVKERRLFSARTAAINGFSIFSKGREFALDDSLRLNTKRVEEFLEHIGDLPFFIFGFTSVVWECLIKYLEDKNMTMDLSRGFLLHGGGWKKLESQKVSSDEFKQRISERIGCSRVHNYYGMIEQTGSIYLECSEGCLHAPAGSDFLIRSTRTLEPLPSGELGLVQLFSNIQTSYPGHSLLSEDIGMFYPAECCSCGSEGKILKIIGRAERAEVRGCSDAAN